MKKARLSKAGLLWIPKSYWAVTFILSIHTEYEDDAVEDPSCLKWASMMFVSVLVFVLRLMEVVVTPFASLAMVNC